jgi:hypothetical protein
VRLHLHEKANLPRQSSPIQYQTEPEQIAGVIYGSVQGTDPMEVRDAARSHSSGIRRQVAQSRRAYQQLLHYGETARQAQRSGYRREPPSHILRWCFRVTSESQILNRRRFP